VGGGLVAGGEDARALEGDVDVQLAVRQLGGVADGGAADRARADVDALAADGDLGREAAVRAVVAEQVGVGLDGPRSLIATTSMSVRPCSMIERSTSRPMRPNPLMATRRAMWRLLQAGDRRGRAARRKVAAV
jgi:hypothetical protein